MKRLFTVAFLSTLLLAVSCGKKETQSPGTEEPVAEIVTEEPSFQNNASDTTSAGTEEYYFTGDFIYMADSANFFDYPTGKRFPVAMELAFPDVERAYAALNLGEPEKISLEVYGRIEERPAMEGDGKEQNLIITKMGKFDRTLGGGGTIVANYANYVPNNTNPDKKTVISLNEDYQASVSKYDFATKKFDYHRQGTWARTSFDEIKIIITNENDAPVNIVETLKVDYSKRPVTFTLGADVFAVE